MRSSLRKIKLLTLLLFIIYVATRDSGVAQMDAAHPYTIIQELVVGNAIYMSIL